MNLKPLTLGFRFFSGNYIETSMKLINKTKNKILAENLEVANSPLKRMKGLLGRSGIAEGEGLHITPCNNIHSFFMKFNFDAIFVDKNNVICGLIRNMSPGRVKFCFIAHSVVELPAGYVAKTGTEVGDAVCFPE